MNEEIKAFSERRKIAFEKMRELLMPFIEIGKSHESAFLLKYKNSIKHTINRMEQFPTWRLLLKTGIVIFVWDKSSLRKTICGYNIDENGCAEFKRNGKTIGYNIEQGLQSDEKNICSTLRYGFGLFAKHEDWFSFFNFALDDFAYAFTYYKR